MLKSFGHCLRRRLHAVGGVRGTWFGYVWKKLSGILRRLRLIIFIHIYPVHVWRELDFETWPHITRYPSCVYALTICSTYSRINRWMDEHLIMMYFRRNNSEISAPNGSGTDFVDSRIPNWSADSWMSLLRMGHAEMLCVTACVMNLYFDGFIPDCLGLV